MHMQQSRWEKGFLKMLFFFLNIFFYNINMLMVWGLKKLFLKTPTTMSMSISISSTFYKRLLAKTSMHH